jgi:YtxH-like protein
MNENSYRNEDSRSGGAGISAFLLGAVVGAGVALLFAPAAGNDTRRKLGDTAKRLGSAARDRIQEGRDKIREGSDKLQDKLHDRFDSERKDFEGARREPAPSAGSMSTGQTGRTATTPGRTTP